MTYNSTPFRITKRLDIRKAGIIAKKDDDRPDKFAATLAHWLQEKGIGVALNSIEADLDIIIVLGGDGTLLHIAEIASRHSIPVLGINMGNLGFLTELTENETFQALEKIFTSEVTIENRLMLRARLLLETNTQTIDMLLMTLLSPRTSLTDC